MGVAVVTGASKGLGRALAGALAADGWSLVVDARDGERLAEAAAAVAARAAPGVRVRAVAGDVTDPAHRRALGQAADQLGGVDLLVNNASVLGASPLPALRDYPLGVLRDVVEVNVVAPLALAQELHGRLVRSGDPRVLNITSDAAVEAYEGWGAYGASKAALEHLSAVLAVEEPTIRVWAVDPGDLRTDMHQAAYPGEDISDRPPPEEAVPGLLALIGGSLPSGRYRVADLAPPTVAERTGARP